MKKNILNKFIKKIPAFVCLVFAFTQQIKAQVSISTANCTISSNELQMDMLITNNGKTDLRWNSAVLRMKVPAGMIPSGKQTYSINYLGGSDFPLSGSSSSPARAFGSSYNASTQILTWTTGNTSTYHNPNCDGPLIGAGQTKTIGRFSFKITSSTFLKGAAADLVWHPSSGCNLYQGCKKTVTAYNEASNLRTLTNSCKLIVPEP